MYAFRQRNVVIARLRNAITAQPPERAFASSSRNVTPTTPLDETISPSAAYPVIPCWERELRRCERWLQEGFDGVCTRDVFVRGEGRMEGRGPGTLDLTDREPY